MKRTLLSVAALAWLTCVGIAEPDWVTYKNARYGFQFAHPSGLVASAEPTDGGGREFYTADGDFSVAAFGFFLVDNDSLEQRFKAELAELGFTVTYQRKTASWYVISGVKGGTEYYHKIFVSGKNGMSIEITYPHAKNQQFDPWVERITKSLTPFLKGHFDRL